MSSIIVFIILNCINIPPHPNVAPISAIEDFDSTNIDPSDLD